jgi:hypothetical protein
MLKKYLINLDIKKIRKHCKRNKNFKQPWKMMDFKW